MVVLGAILVVGAVLAVIFITFFAGKQHNINDRIRGRLEFAADPNARADPFSSNAGGWATPILQFIALAGVARLYAPLLRRCGFFTPHAASVYLVIKLIYLVILGFGIMLVPQWIWDYFHNIDINIIKFILLILFFFMPDYLYLYQKQKAYKARIERDLPFWLDLHTSIVEGGVGFDEAIALIISQRESLNRPIFNELDQAYRQVAIGSSRVEALKIMAERLDVDPLRVVVAGIAQGEAMGAGMVEVLRGQADMVRNKIWEEAQNRAHQLPVQLTFPMMIGVLPMLFLILLAPPFLQIFHMFSKLGMGKGAH